MRTRQVFAQTVTNFKYVYTFYGFWQNLENIHQNCAGCLVLLLSYYSYLFILKYLWPGLQISTMWVQIMVWNRALKFTPRLEYEYAQVAVDLFCENVILVHCSVVVCNYISPFFLKEYRKFEIGSTVLCDLTRETRLTRHKPIAQCTRLLACMKLNVPSSMVTLSPDGP